MEQTLI